MKRQEKTFEILYEDPSILAVLKPSGLPVHGPNGGNVPPESHLEGQVKIAFGDKVVLLHRLDRETSGVVLFSRTRKASAAMSQNFEQKKIRKAYLAVTQGQWPRAINKVESYLSRGEKKIISSMDATQGQHSLTTFRVLAANAEKTFLEAMPKTGRTHQIRVHCASQGHTILGDRIYGKEELPGAQALHAYRVDFKHPETGEPMQIIAPPPREWLEHWLQGLDVTVAFAKLFAEKNLRA